MRGVPSGYQHNWKYRGRWREKKVGKGTWVGEFNAVKSRHGSARGGLPVGSRVRWHIEGYQTAEKVAGRTYMTRFKFKKRLVNVSPKRSH